MTGSPVAELVVLLKERGLTLGVAESLTGGMLVAEFVSVPGASAVVQGGIVAYQTPLKAALLGVSESLLAEHGAVHPRVASEMATGVRTAVAIGGVPATVGLSTTGVAGPDPQDGQPVGTVFVGVSIGDRVEVTELHLEGDRQAIRTATVSESLSSLRRMLLSTGSSRE
ncbi:CinA family protein [Frondihabitans cladoniiphilus]|uniref:CinA family protein n=1 Tax=Frondihabitans cladoniiphilus TaxID=715785 RepID=A0ABP8VRY8_9MICO